MAAVRQWRQQFTRPVCYLLLLSILVSLSLVLVYSHSWGHPVGEPKLEELPIWKRCCQERDCVPQQVKIIGKAKPKKVWVDIEGVQTSVDKEKFSPVPSDRTWVCYIIPNGVVSNENIQCILYPQESGTT